MTRNSLIFFGSILRFIGIKELDNKNNFDSALMLDLLKPTGWHPGQKYCAFGLKGVLFSVYNFFFDEMIFWAEVQKLMSGSVSDTKKSLELRLRFSKKAISGSLFYRLNTLHGNHCGFCWYANDDGSFYSIEFNVQNMCKPMFRPKEYLQNCEISFFPL
jgi:hypothetical protein